MNQTPNPSTESPQRLSWPTLGFALQAERNSLAFHNPNSFTHDRLCALRRMKRLMQKMDEGARALQEILGLAYSPTQQTPLWKDLVLYLAELRVLTDTADDTVACFLEAVLASVLETAKWGQFMSQAAFVGQLSRLPFGASGQTLGNWPGAKEKLRALKRKYPGYKRKQRTQE